MDADDIFPVPPPWDKLSLAAGPPPPRPATAHERLFDSDKPLLQLWHDRANWCPFCTGIRMILEDMRIPHTLKKISLHDYMAPDERLPQEFVELTGPYGVIPAVQLASNTGASREIEFGPVTQNAYAVAAILADSFPDIWLMPRAFRRRGCEQAQLNLVRRLETSFFPFLLALTSGSDQNHFEDIESQFKAVMDDIAGAFEGAKKQIVADFQRHSNSSFSFESTADANVSIAHGARHFGPFLFGNMPSAVDFLLLPLLERIDALLPHPLIGNRPDLCLEKNWPSVANMLAAVRQPGACAAYSEFGSDVQTLVAMSLRRRESGRYRTPGFVSGVLVSQVASPGTLCLETFELQRDACCMAAAALCSNHAAVASFSVHGMGVGRFWPGDESEREAADANTKSVNAADSILRLVTSLLLEEPTLCSTLQRRVCAFAKFFFDKNGVDCTHRVVEGLNFLVWNVSVPRDMAAQAAHALRTYVRFVSSILNCVAHGGELCGE